MSASRERKKRMQEVNVPAAEPKKKKNKLSGGWLLAICVVLVLALVFGGIFGYRAYQRNRTVLTVGSHEIKVSEFNFFYYNTVSSFSSYANYVGIDTTKPVDKQNVTTAAVNYLPLFGVDTSSFTDLQANEAGEYDITWAQLFASVAKDTAVQTYAIYNEAVANGYTLDAQELAEIDEEMASLDTMAASQGETADEMIARVFGNGCDKEGYRNYMIVSHTASHYPASLSYTEDEINARYEESKETFDIVSFYAYTARPSDYVEANEDGTKPEPAEKEKTQAKTDAEKMESSFDTEAEKVNVCADYTKASVTSAYGEEAATWLFDTASTDGENVKLFEKDGTYYVIKLAAKGDYQSYNAVELFIANDSGELAEGEKTAKEKVAAIEESLKADGSEENFRALVKEYVGGESDGTVENMMRNSMAGVGKSVFAWGLEQHKAGDFASLETSSGTMFLYITGEGNTRRNVSVSNTLRNEKIEELTAAAAANCGYDEDAAMAGSVSLVLHAN